MESGRLVALLYACLGLTIVPAHAGPSRAGPANPAGDWQTVIEAPSRPWIFRVHLERAADHWAGAMTIEGLGAFPLSEVGVDSTRVRFRLPVQFDSRPFEGEWSATVITGTVPWDDGPVPVRLSRIEPLPVPADRTAAWRQDLELAARELPDYDRSFTPATRERFRRAVTGLERSVPGRDDPQILVALSQAIALAGNAHTHLRLDPTRAGAFATEFPLRLWWFPDGPHVVRAAAPYRRAVRCRVVAIDGRPWPEVARRVATMFAGNAAWSSYVTPIGVVSPDALYGLGLTRGRDAANFTFADSGGARFDLVVRATPSRVDARAAESWQELSPFQPAPDPAWTIAPCAGPDGVPLYLRHPDRPYWFEFEPRTGMVYFQYNRAQDADRGPGFRQFADSLRAFLDRPEVVRLVVDLRLNSGGDLNVAREFLASLATMPRFDRPDRLFVIVGRCTFSAGLYHAAQLRQLTRATFLGEPVGDRLDYWAEGGRIVLPNSGATIEYANGFHRYSGREYPDRRPYYEALAVADLRPDRSTPLTAADYFAGRDPALLAVRRMILRPGAGGGSSPRAPIRSE